MTREEARRSIVEAAATFRRRRLSAMLGTVTVLPKPLSMRHLHQCVHICRVRGLVTNEVLTVAGFRPARPVKETPR